MDDQDFNKASYEVDTYILSEIEKDYIVRTLKAGRQLCADTNLTREQEKHVYDTIMHELGGESE
ncbi:hypothetical protein [Sporolactobacillus terrae]|uniref:hypothetical protein n=1 Tax=Sporolactobacillus terrae TaxID=269673 RepID=UPI00048BE8ED|nr:hypothetical protein [Sporolactobacillus terrae]